MAVLKLFINSKRLWISNGMDRLSNQKQACNQRKKGAIVSNKSNHNLSKTVQFFSPFCYHIVRLISYSSHIRTTQLQWTTRQQTMNMNKHKYNFKQINLYTHTHTRDNSFLIIWLHALLTLTLILPNWTQNAKPENSISRFKKKKKKKKQRWVRMAAFYSKKTMQLN